MTCAECRTVLTAWVDDELPPRELDAVVLHLNACPDCRRLADRDRAFVQALRRAVRRLEAPPDLRGRLLALARGGAAPATRPFSVPWRTAVPVGAAAICALLAAGGWRWHQAARDRTEWCRAFIDDHREGLLEGVRMEVRTGSAERLGAWFSERLGKPIRPVRLPAGRDARLLGGRRCYLKGQLVGLALYETEWGRLSVFVAPRDRVAPPGWRTANGRVHTISEEGYSLAAWEVEDSLMVLVTDQTEIETGRLAGRLRDAVHSKSR